MSTNQQTTCDRPTSPLTRRSTISILATHLTVVLVLAGCTRTWGTGKFDEHLRTDFNRGMTVAQVEAVVQTYPVDEPVTGRWPSEGDWAARFADRPALAYQPWNNPTQWIINGPSRTGDSWSGPVVVAANVLNPSPPRFTTVQYMRPHAIWFWFDDETGLKRWGHTIGRTLVEHPDD